MSARRLLALLSAACLAAGCATLQTSVRSDPAADFSRYRTFRIERDRLETGTQQWLNEQISARLAGKGLAPAEKDADLQVVPRQFRNRATADSTGYGWWTGGLMTQTTEDIPAGTLVVDLVDLGKKQLVWRGMATGTIPSSGALRRDKVERALDRLFAEFPRKTAAK
ncbi:MAG: DUF4136 domain-containing protein [Thermoanaerobaculia bacterium]